MTLYCFSSPFSSSAVSNKRQRWLSLGVFFVVEIYLFPDEVWNDAVLGPILRACVVLIVLLLAMPVMMAFEPAEISSLCDSLREKLTAMRCKDSKAIERVEPLYNTLGLVNKV